ncbi:MAG: radical SAM protein [Puniceicoccales bacterium]|jgi:23S rRNA (adenine-C8)-methyltransferase|nr:radical SAM protein [Puniceicoccales bacterium]
MQLQRFSFNALKDFLKQQNEPIFRYKQLQQALFREPHLTFHELTTLPLPLREKLISVFGDDLLPLRLLRVQKGMQASKYLFALQDGERIESVYMQFQEGLKSLCISTQVGCACRCAFCATGKIGIQRNLTVEEILGQVLYVSKTVTPIDRITIMGMGEALLNPHIFEVIHHFTATDEFQLSPYKLSISTVGIVPGIRKLTQLYPQVTLTFSLHFPSQTLREQWMPTAQHHRLEDIFEALDERAKLTNRKIYLAYMVMDGINNRLQDLEALKSIFEARGPLRHLYHVNLIPFHPIPHSKVQETHKSVVLRFQKQLKQHRIVATVRQSFGKSIQAACGQLSAAYPVHLQKSS